MKPSQVIRWSNVSRTTRVPGRITASGAGKLLTILGVGAAGSGSGPRHVIFGVTTISETALGAVTTSSETVGGAGVNEPLPSWAVATEASKATSPVVSPPVQTVLRAIDGPWVS